MFKKPSSGKKTNLSQFGLIDVDVDDEPMDLSDDDVDLEAELAAITGGGGAKHRPRKPAPVPAAALDAMIAESLKDIPSDEDGSGDDDDSDLLNELQELGLEDAPPPSIQVSRPAPPPPGQTSSNDSSTVSLLHDRISNYTLAEKTAKEKGDSSRARRFGRGLKTLNDLLKQTKAGKPIKDEDIPPAVSLGTPAATQTPSAPQITPPSSDTTPTSPEITPTAPDAPPPELPKPLDPEPVAPPVPPRTTSMEEPSQPPNYPPPSLQEQGMSSSRQQGFQVILRRKEEFKAAALASKHAGDKTMALEYMKVVKQFDLVVDAYKSGEEMDLNELPTPQSVAAMIRSQQKTEEQTQNSAEVPEPPPADQEPTVITASTVDEALKQRLAAFQTQEAKAKEEGNSSKARRMGRIVKQYQDAIKLHAKGKPIPVDELPTPAGHGPIPTEGGASSSAPSPPRPSPAPTPSPRAPAPAPRASTTRYDKQILFLLQRQKEFKEAAIKAKKTGNIEQAKEYLRAAKGFDAVIEAAKGGLTVDLKSLPLPPTDKKKIEKTFDIISAEDCDPPDEPQPMSLEDDDVLTRLHQQLTSQLKLCLCNRDHYKAMGNVAETNRFEHMAVSVKQDLDVVSVAKRRGIPPKFHYESRQFSVVQCNTDLNENDLELTIVRGIAYNVPNPKEVDTYVKFEFPYPQETPVSDRTACIKDTNSPQYDAVFNLAINRAARPCLRVFKRHAVKFEVYSRGGWFSKDSLLGAVSVKLEPLQDHVTIHEAFPIMEGRRPAGGSLEVKLRVRTPLLQQQFETTTHKWLVIDN